MKYIALLRGINVGGNNPVKMADLKVAFEKIGYLNVVTYINSGNVIFESEKDAKILTKEIEELLTKTFHYTARVLIISQKQYKKVVEDVPNDWNTRADIRCYVSFVIEPLTADEAAKEIKLKEGIDFMVVKPGVLYMTTLTSGLTKSGFTKMIGTPMYQNITMRNYNTVKKIYGLLEA